jgi:hypothetical protein
MWINGLRCKAGQMRPMVQLRMRSANAMRLNSYRDESHSKHFDLIGGGEHPWSIDLVSVTASGILVCARRDHQNEKDHRSDRWSQKPRRLFVGNALPCLATPVNSARRLAGCCRVDARFTLAFWTLTLGRWPLDTGPVGPWSPSALVAWALVVFGSGRCEKPARSTADNPTADPTNSPDDYQWFLHKI